MKISDKAFDLIREFEGIDQPGEWPGGASGITIGFGYDLGYEDSFEQDWSPFLTADGLDRLGNALGKTGNQAREIAHEYRDIRISRQAAESVLKAATIPKYEAKTLHAFPGSDRLNPDAFGALVSLVFNRGELVDDSDRRFEMRKIKSMMQAPDYAPDSRELLEAMAAQFEHMTRLWPNVRGLRRRRLAEAQLIRDSISRVVA